MIRLQRDCHDIDYRDIVIKQLEIRNCANGGRKRYYMYVYIYVF